MKQGRFEAIDHVRIEAPLGVEEELRFFYGELLDLEEADELAPDCEIAFRSAYIELRIHLCSEPNVSEMAERVTISVESLSGVRDELEERGIAYQLTRGFSASETRISLIDPGGNRIELKQKWPEFPF